ncbi:MAG: fumarylacetoacetate hydrolase family protein [Alphaproteobacteria bacterium]|nr:fumarylacetoacetate hydrolase family protein [Alphaproteobacteria bacterium]
MEYVITPPEIVSIAVVGRTERFPVRRIYCVGRNYMAHIREMGGDERALPFYFTKPADAIVATGSSIDYPPQTSNFHYECELVAAIGKGGRDISEDAALDHVYGYAVGLDMTRRDIQIALREKGRPWDMGKSFDQSAPCGDIHPVDQVGHFPKGNLWLKVNGETQQDTDLELMIWNLQETIANLSGLVELAPGDLIYTGTPEGVGPVVSGDTMLGHIDGLSDLEITVR